MIPMMNRPSFKNAPAPWQGKEMFVSSLFRDKNFENQNPRCQKSCTATFGAVQEKTAKKQGETKKPGWQTMATDGMRWQKIFSRFPTGSKVDPKMVMASSLGSWVSRYHGETGFRQSERQQNEA